MPQRIIFKMLVQCLHCMEHGIVYFSEVALAPAHKIDKKIVDVLGNFMVGLRNGYVISVCNVCKEDASTLKISKET